MIAQLLNVHSVRLGPILKNRFAPSLHATLALELCLIYEDLLQRRHTNQGALGALIASPPLVGAINLRTDPEQRELNRRSATPADYDQLSDEILDAGQPSGFVRALTDRELDSAVALTTRNRAGHVGEHPTATDNASTRSFHGCSSRSSPHSRTCTPSPREPRVTENLLC